MRGPVCQESAVLIFQVLRLRSAAHIADSFARPASLTPSILIASLMAALRTLRTPLLNFASLRHVAVLICHAAVAAGAMVQGVARGAASIRIPIDP
jgi:hypothetical protein